MDKQKISVIALLIALFALTQYVIYERIIETRQQEIANAYQNGYKKGLTDVVVTIYQQTEKCQTTSITIGNLTRNVVDFSCMQAHSKNGTR